MLQTHLNNLATRLSQDRVKHARSYLKSIFDEAIGQDFLLNDPTRKLKVPNRLRPKDKQVLTWGQLREALQKCSQRDRALLMLDMTSALRPSELFALRWRSFDNRNTLSITETVYKGQIGLLARPGKVSGIFICHLDWPPNSCGGSRLVQTARPMRSCFRIRRVARWIPATTGTGFSSPSRRN